MTANLPIDDLRTLIARLRGSHHHGDAVRADALEVLVKGAEDVKQLIGLAKASTEMSDSDPETDSEEGKPDTTEDEAMGKGGYSGDPVAKGEGGEGYGKDEESEEGEESSESEKESDENMGKGADDVSIVDATELVKGLDGRLTGMTVLANQILDELRATTTRQDALDARLANMEALTKGIGQQAELMARAVGALGEHVSTGFVALTKASMESMLTARELAPGVAGVSINPQRAMQRHAGNDGRASDSAFTVEQLIKGSNNRVISSRQAELFRQTGRFDNDDARNAELMRSMSNLVNKKTT